MHFRGDCWFLSNMYQCEITYNGHTFSCVEATFQAQKDLSRVSEFEGISGQDAKRLGRRVNLRPDWESVKDNIMLEILRIKFSDPTLRKKLIHNKTIIQNNGVIVEDNTWGDTYWGVCNGTGQNKLGQLLSEIRNEYIAQNLT